MVIRPVRVQYTFRRDSSSIVRSSTQCISSPQILQTILYFHTQVYKTLYGSVEASSSHRSVSGRSVVVLRSDSFRPKSCDGRVIRKP